MRRGTHPGVGIALALALTLAATPAALLAAWMSARRATEISPSRALRSE